ncbi:MAG: S9 family peptidase, partial [Actinomycetota bacterium]|nr:S9 family peptidase [Actinomycetota bacterium]
MSDDTFPRQYARTRRLTLGAPRDLRVTADGRTLVFLRSAAGDDPVNALWAVDLDGGPERLLVDPRQPTTSSGTSGIESAAERAIRERRREQAGGITSFS